MHDQEKRGRGRPKAPKPDYAASAIGNNAAERLRSLVERIERLEEERRGLGSDIKDIYTEAKSAGFDPAVLKTIVRDRRKDAAEVAEREALMDIYKRALGMIADLPLGRAAIERAGG